MPLILQGDCLAELAKLPDESVHCCVTSPPYFGLRDYGFEGQIGLEKAPEEYVNKLVKVFREVRRVLRNDGTLWLNLGDSYAGSNQSGGTGKESITGGKRNQIESMHSFKRGFGDLKPKDLIGIPWLVAKALQQPYYTGCIKSELDRVWLAATIDAEGTIAGFTHTRKDDGRTRTGIHVSITNSNMKMLDRAAQVWPASIVDHGRPGPGHIGKLDTYRWIAHNVDKKSLLMQEIYPYLTVKKDQARLAYNFFEMSREAKRLARTREADIVKDRRRWIVKALSDLNHLKDVNIPDWCIEPPTLYEPGFYLRSDIIWHKPNPMPESVADRCTKAHEYVFMLTKSARYYYDAEAVKEPQAKPKGSICSHHKYSDGNSDPKGGGFRGLGGLDGRVNNGYRNRRDVWTIATKPFNGARLVADYVSYDGRPCIASPDCPIHSHLADSQKWHRLGYDGRQDPLSLRTLGIENHPDPESYYESSARQCHDNLDGHRSMMDCHCPQTSPPRTPENIDDYRMLGYHLLSILGERIAYRTNHKSTHRGGRVDNLDYVALAYSELAMKHSTQIHKMAPALETNLSCSVFSRTPCHIDDIRVLSGLSVPSQSNSENNISEVFDEDRAARTPFHNTDISISLDNLCTCKVYKVDHFATMPPELAEICIKAGCPEGGTVLDPFAGSGTTGAVAKSLGRDYILIEANNDYIKLIDERIDNAPLPSRSLESFAEAEAES